MSETRVNDPGYKSVATIGEPSGNEIERRSQLSYEAFAKDYLYPNCPVIITDALSQWNAVQRWTPEFFKQEFGGLTFSIEDNLSGALYEHTHAGVKYKMEDFIDRVLGSTERDPAPYFRNKVLYDLFPSLKQDIEPLPQYLFPNWLSDRFLVKRVAKQLNRGAEIEIYIGGRGGSFPVLHYDGSATHAFLMQIYGRKRFILYSPDQEQFLYPSPLKKNLSLVNSIYTPDLSKFPLFQKAIPTTFVLEPGELLFVPSRWWHTTKMLTPCISISINTANQSNWNELVNFVSMRRNPIPSLAGRIYLFAAGAYRSWRDRNYGKRA